MKILEQATETKFIMSSMVYSSPLTSNTSHKTDPVKGAVLTYRQRTSVCVTFEEVQQLEGDQCEQLEPAD